MNITETCSCGAKVEVDDRSETAAATAVQQWRTGHRHAAPEHAPSSSEPEPKADPGSLTTTRVSATADTRPPAFGFTTRKDLR